MKVNVEISKRLMWNQAMQRGMRYMSRPAQSWATEMIKRNHEIITGLRSLAH